jgi:hypothetical protein
MRGIRATEARKRVRRVEEKSEKENLRRTKKTLMERIRRASKLGNSSYIAYWEEGASIELRERIEKWLQQLGYRVKACEKMTIIDWEEPHNDTAVF